MSKFILPLFIFLMPALTFAAPAAADPSTRAMVFYVIQDQYSFDIANIKAVSIYHRPDGTYAGLHLELKDNAAPDFLRMTQAGIGKKLMLVLNKKVVHTATIQSALNGNIVVTGITPEDAHAFIGMLNNKKKK